MQRRVLAKRPSAHPAPPRPSVRCCPAPRRRRCARRGIRPSTPRSTAARRRAAGPMLASASHAPHRTPGTDRPVPWRGRRCSALPPDRSMPTPRPRKGGRADPGATAPRRGRPKGWRPSSKLPSARAASPATSESSSLNARLSAGCIGAVSGARSIRASAALRREIRSCRSSSTSSGRAGGPTRRMISRVLRSSSSLSRFRSRLSTGSDAPPPGRGRPRRWREP